MKDKKNYKYIRKIIFFILSIEFLLVGCNFWLLTEKMSFDICRENCKVRDFAKNEKSYLKENISDSIHIPKINVRAPIIFNSGITEDEILNNLNNGVVYYSSSDLPDGSGITLLFGHSSNYWWVDSEFNNIFSLISELAAGDGVKIYYKGKQYNYSITSNKIINSSQWDEIKNPENESGLALVTCWPLGTNLKRLVVFAQKIN